jgi:hypothetical protein
MGKTGNWLKAQHPGRTFNRMHRPKSTIKLGASLCLVNLCLKRHQSIVQGTNMFGSLITKLGMKGG